MVRRNSAMLNDSFRDWDESNKKKKKKCHIHPQEISEFYFKFINKIIINKLNFFFLLNLAELFYLGIC